MQRMNVLWSPIALFYQARRDLVERALTASGLTILVGSLLQGYLAYPPQWFVVLVIAVFAASLYHRTAGYLTAVAAVAWPLWQLSPYLATLFLAIAVLAREPLVTSLEWTILVVGAPLLAPLGVVALVPLAAGALLGAAGGLWVGLLTALWLKLIGGMAGVAPDMLSLHQYPILVSEVAARFQGANSLETLRLLVAPFASDATFLLLDLLQLLLWGLAGYIVGWIRRLPWAEREPWVSLLPALVTGALFLWMSLFLVPVWLELAPVALLWSDPYVITGLGVAVLGAATLYTLRYFLRRPVRQLRWRALPSSQHRWPETSPAAQAPSAAAPSSRRAGAAPRNSKPDEGPAGDVIMLELD